MTKKKKIKPATLINADNFLNPKRDRYWLVHNPQRTAPVVRHYLRGDADNEATRLAEKHPGETFYVLEVVSAFAAEVSPPAACIITTPSAVPF